MKRSTWKKRALASMLALAMTAGMLPMASAATQASAPKAGEDTGLEMNKTAKLEDDGTYTINLEAYATGEVIQTVKTTPTDIVLLLDVSASMGEEKLDVLDYKQTQKYIWRAVNTKLYHKCNDGVHTRVQVQSKQNDWFDYTYFFDCPHCGTHKESGDGVQKVPNDWQLYEQSVKQIYYIEALQRAVNGFIDSVAEKNAKLQPDQRHSISLVKFSGKEEKTTGNDTYRRDGYRWNYSQIVKEMTVMDQDTAVSFKGAVNTLEPNGGTRVDNGMKRAVAALQDSPKDHNKVIILFSDGEPTKVSDYDEGVANSAIDTAKMQKDKGVTMYSIAVMEGANPSDTRNRVNKFFHAMSSNYPHASSMRYLGNRAPNSDYYKTAADADELSNIFQELVDDSTVTKVTLDEKAVLKDIVANEFTVPESATVTAEAVKCTGKDGDGNYTWAETGTSLDQRNITQSGNSISVTGFNYKEQCVVENKDGTYSGSKLVVTIKGVEALDAAATGTKIDTNAPGSGIYENAEKTTPVAEFVSPKTLVNKELYVLDYAKEATLTGMPNTTTHLDGDGMNYFTDKNTSLDEKYGTVSGDTYTPTAMNWDGYDQYYVFGQWNDNIIPEGVTTGVNAWTKVAVMPANNVYYEDDFITTKDGSTVGIEYTGDWKEVSDNTEDCGNNTETPNNGIHGGWENTDLADDTEYSDGSAHQASGTATASFKFTGTGVDVYTRTNINTLTVMAQLVDKNNKTQTLIMNNKATSGDYYQIPTLSFAGLEYGTYTVTIYVSGSSGTYYLDGIRVYNPIRGLEEDEIVKDAYADELGATFKEVRDILLDAAKADEKETFTGALFLDKNPDGTQAVGEYKDYGPKNEVYLGKNQSVAFEVNGTDPVYVGLKAPKGHATVQMTNANAKTAEMPIDHSTDLYYKVVPNSEGQIVITNVGEGLLSITKLRTTGATTVAEASVEALLSYANTMDTLPEVPYGNEGSDGSEDGGNVDIENPDQGQETPSQGNSFLDIVKDIFESIWNLF